MGANDAFKTLIAERKEKLAKQKQGKEHIEETIHQKLQRIKTEIDEIERVLKVIEEDKGKDKMKECEFDAKALTDLADIKKKLEELLQSKGIIKWEGPSPALASSQLNQSITKNMMNSLSVIFIKHNRV